MAAPCKTKEQNERKGISMVRTNRRQFVKATAGVCGAAAMSTMSGGCLESLGLGGKWKGFRYAMCNESMQELPWDRQCKIVGNAGYQGIEIAAFTLVKEGVQEISAGRRSGPETIAELSTEPVDMFVENTFAIVNELKYQHISLVVQFFSTILEH